MCSQLPAFSSYLNAALNIIAKVGIRLELLPSFAYLRHVTAKVSQGGQGENKNQRHLSHWFMFG
jgi:hypothetical protein